MSEVKCRFWARIRGGRRRQTAARGRQSTAGRLRRREPTGILYCQREQNVVFLCGSLRPLRLRFYRKGREGSQRRRCRPAGYCFLWLPSAICRLLPPLSLFLHWLYNCISICDNKTPSSFGVPKPAAFFTIAQRWSTLNCLC